MAVYLVRFVVRSEAGIEVTHQFHIESDTLANAQTKAASIAVSYQPCIAVQLASVTVDGVATPFTQLRTSPVGNHQRRLFISCVGWKPFTVTKRNRITFALTDPIPEVRDFLLGLSENEPSEWTDFVADVIPEMTSKNGVHIEKILSASYTDAPRAADGEEAVQSRSRDSWAIPVIKHASNHLDNGNDPIIYVRSQFFNVQNLRFGAVGYVTLGLYDCVGFLASGTTGLSGALLLDDWSSGDITVRVYYVTNTTSGGNVRLQLRYASRSDGGSQAVETTKTATVQMGAASQVHVHSPFVIDAADVAKGDLISFYLERLGNDAADTETQSYPVFGIGFSYLAKFPH